MKALLRPAFVLGLSIAIAATSFIGSSSVALAATPPLVPTWSLDLPVYEGADVFLNGTFTGGVGNGPYTVEVYWLGAVGPSEMYDFATLPVRNPCFPGTVGACWTVRVQKAEPYANDQPDPITIVVYLSDPQKTNRTNLAAFTIANTAPSFESFDLSSTNPETDQAVTATGVFKDAGSADTHTVTLDWGDGTVPTVTSLGTALTFTTEPHSYKTADVFTVTATVADDAGATAVATSTVTVTAPNQAPTIAVSSHVTAGPEGGTTTLALAFADADALDTHTVSVAWGDGETTNSGDLAADVTTFDASHVYANTGSYSLVVTLKDSATPAHTLTREWSVSPTNVGPVLGSLSVSPSSVVDHQELTLTGSFTDPGTDDTFTLFVTWGDGASSEQPLGTARSFSPTHSYAAAGPITITATVQDRDGATSNSSSVSLDVLSSNHAPTGLAFDASATGANVVVTGTFSDADAADTDTVVVTWGDGASERQTLAAGATTFTASHVYAASNTYTVTVTVTDPALASTGPLSKQVPVTVPATSASDLIDEMSSAVWSFDLDRNTERWLMRKLSDLKDSLAYGNGQVCSSSGTLNHVLAFAQRTLTSDQYGTLSALAIQVGDAAGCTTNVAQLPKVQKAATVTTTAVTPALTTTPAQPQAAAPEQKEDTATKDATKTATKTAKSESKATAGRNSN